MAENFLKNSVKIRDKKKIKKYLNSINSISNRKHSNLRKEKIGQKTSEIATIKVVRDFVNTQQKILVSKMPVKYRGCVIDGRDIGSKVFKNAQIKLFINVKLEIRAKRRHKQLIQKGEKSIYSRILKDIKLRDKTDITRKESPLKVPNGATIIDNSRSFNITIAQIKQTFKRFKVN